jgi:hypothetical protein
VRCKQLFAFGYIGMPLRKSKSWQEQFEQLWNELVPGSGQAETIQGEMVRAIGRLTDEAYRNGNGNWDDGYCILVQYLRDHLVDSTVFNKFEIDEVKKCLERILDYERPDISGSSTCYYRLAEKVVRWCLSKKSPIPHKKNPALYR